MEDIHCEVCGKIAPSFDLIHYGSADSGYRMLCTHCFNERVAVRCGLPDFENIKFDPIRIVDRDGAPHEFHFRTRLMGNVVSLDAFELHDGKPGGYTFQEVGEPEQELFALLGKLIQKMRRALPIKHITEGDLGLQIVDQTVRGSIEWDEEEDGRVPLLMIDGRQVTWDEFGKMLMSFEGWQFKLEIVDPSGDV